MKILIIPSWYPPDGGMFFQDMAMGLLRRGHEVAILYAQKCSTRSAIKRRSLFFQKSISISNENGLLVYRNHYNAIPKLAISNPQLYAMTCARLFSRYVKEHGLPDIVHAHSSVWGGYAAAFIKRKFQVPYVITEHRGRFTLMTPEAKKLVQWWFSVYLKRAFHGADSVILVGSLLLNGLERYRREQVRWEIISNGVDTDFFIPNFRAAGVFTFVTVCGLIREKGVHSLLHAFLRLRESGAKTNLIIVGDGPERNSLQEFCNKTGIAHTVSFLGRLSREGVRDALQCADAFVLPTRTEAQSVSILEAISCGLPVITTVAVPPELCPPFIGVRLPIDDTDALTATLQYVYRNYDSFDRDRIREFTVAEHDRTVVTDKILTLYDHILA